MQALFFTTLSELSQPLYMLQNLWNWETSCSSLQKAHLFGCLVRTLRALEFSPIVAIIPVLRHLIMYEAVVLHRLCYFDDWLY